MMAGVRAKELGPAKWLVAWMAFEWAAAFVLYLHLQYAIFGAVSVVGFMYLAFGACVAHAALTLRLADPLRAPMHEGNLDARLWLMVAVPVILFLGLMILLGIHSVAAQKGWSQGAELLLQYVAVVVGLQALSLFLIDIYRKSEPR